VRVVAKPAFGSLLLWKTIYLFDGRYHVDALRLGRHAKSFPGQSAAKLEVLRDLAWLDPKSQQARDLERFTWFSSGMTAIDPANPDSVIDVRYSMVPNRIEALWGIRLDSSAAVHRHADFFTSRSPSSKHRAEIRRMFFD
jgi:inner membrane protein